MQFAAGLDVDAAGALQYVSVTMQREQHPIIEAAGLRAELPEWARSDPTRRGHSERVAELLDGWAAELGLPERERVRWRAAGILHDALKDASIDELRSLAGPGWPDPVLHAPACAARLRADDVRDEGLLLAVAYHPVGHPDFDLLGEFMFMADFLEPGRASLTEERATLRARLPAERREVLVTVLAYRLNRLLDLRTGLMSSSVNLWNRLAES